MPPFLERKRMEEARSAVIGHIQTAHTQGPDKKVKLNLKYMRDRDRESVTGVFRYYEVPNGVMEFVYREYKEDPVEKFRMFDGEIYTVPRGVMRHLNKNGWYPEYEHYNTERGLQMIGNHGPMVAGINPDMPHIGMRVGKKIKRFAFESMEFLEMDDVPGAQRIINVEMVPAK